MPHFWQSFQNRVKVSLGILGPLEYWESLEIKAQTNPSFTADGWHPVGIDRSIRVPVQEQIDARYPYRRKAVR
ncbi:hypothetical protein QFZ94_008459 [Paraburkholderia sp. JPY465]